MMIPSKACIDLIKACERLELKSYLCPAGIPTIGYGHTEGVDLGQELHGADEAERLLAHDLEQVAPIIAKHVTVPLTQGQYDAITSFVFNAGPGAPGGKDGFVWLKARDAQRRPVHSTMLRKLNAGDYQGAAAEFPKWARGGGKILGGLVTRRAAEQKLFLS
jgi:lysozyme